MNRRTVLAWISRVLGAAVAVAAGLPGVRFAWDSLQAGGAAASARRRIARWTDLRPGQPVQIPLVGQRQDAWMTQPNEVIGRVWLVRRSTDETPTAGAVAAFTSICPHMGCQIHLHAKGDAFMCPCHRATFELDGQPRSTVGERNHAPRGMDELECQLVQDESDGEWWVEVKYERFEQGLTVKVAKA